MAANTPSVVMTKSAPSSLSWEVWGASAFLVAGVATIILGALIEAQINWPILGSGAAVSLASFVALAVKAKTAGRDEKVEPENLVRAREALMPTLESLPLVPPHTPIFALVFADQQSYEDFKRIWVTVKPMQMTYVDERREVLFYHSPLEINNVMRLCKEAIPFFFDGEKSIFEGSPSPRGTSFRQMYEIDARKEVAFARLVARVSEASCFATDPFFIPQSRAPDFNLDEWLTAHFADKRSLMVGETHSNTLAMRFLIRRMPFFKRCGVRAIVLEGFKYDTMQKDLDEVNRTKKMTFMVKLFASAMDSAWGVKTHGMHDLIQAAIENDMELVGWEAYFLERRQKENAAESVVPRNVAAYSIVTHRVKGPYILAAGHAHGMSHLNEHSKIGFREIFHAPLLWVLQGDQERESARINFEQGTTRVDISVILPPEKENSHA